MANVSKIKSMNKEWGCEEWFPNKAYHGKLYTFAQKTGVKFLKVPVRENGLTSSGTKNYCWFNVAQCVEAFKGKIILGWYVARINAQASYQLGGSLVGWYLQGHAIWLNDEGKASCVTKSNIAPDASKPFQNMIFTEGGKKFILYAVFGQSENWTDTICNVEIEDDKKCPHSRTVVLDHPRGFIKTDLSALTPLSLNNVYDKRALLRSGNSKISPSSYGGFSERSLASGKTLAEIRAH